MKRKIIRFISRTILIMCPYIVFYIYVFRKEADLNLLISGCIFGALISFISIKYIKFEMKE